MPVGPAQFRAVSRSFARFRSASQALAQRLLPPRACRGLLPCGSLSQPPQLVGLLRPRPLALLVLVLLALLALLLLPLLTLLLLTLLIPILVVV